MWEKIWVSGCNNLNVYLYIIALNLLQSFYFQVWADYPGKIKNTAGIFNFARPV